MTAHRDKDCFDDRVTWLACTNGDQWGEGELLSKHSLILKVHAGQMQIYACQSTNIGSCIRCIREPANEPVLISTLSIDAIMQRV